MDSSLRGILIFILIISALNLVINGIQLQLSLRNTPINDALPEFVNAKERARLADRVTTLYNRDDTAALYAAFDPLAKAELSQATFATQIAQMKNIVGHVDSSTYLGYQKGPRQLGAKSFQLNYSVKLSGREFKARHDDD